MIANGISHRWENEKIKIYLSEFKKNGIQVFSVDDDTHQLKLEK